ncbi:hypothetical protein Tco_0650851 [Tanacetum coccineum]
MSSLVNLSRFLQELFESTRIISIECHCYAWTHNGRDRYISGLDDLIPPGIESDFDSEEDNLLNDDSIPEYERLTFIMKPDVPVINNVDELNEDECFDPGGGLIQNFLKTLVFGVCPSPLKLPSLCLPLVSGNPIS